MKICRPLLALVLCLLVACSGSESPRRGQLMVALATDMSVPKDVTHIRIEVKLGPEVRYEYDYQIAPDGEFHIPGTLAVVEGSTPNPVVSVEVVGIRQLKSGANQARTFAKATTTIPRERMALLRVPVQWLCDGTAVDDGSGQYLSSCSEVDGQEAACISGTCQPVAVDSDALPTFDSALVYGGGATPSDPVARCFDTLSCFDKGRSLDLTALSSSCTFTVPDDGSTLNVALSMPPGGDGICHGDAQSPPCYIPFDQDDVWGWRVLPLVSGGMRTVQLPPAACDAVRTKRALAVRVTTTCETKTSEYPTCGPWSAVSEGSDLGSGSGGLSGNAGANGHPATTGEGGSAGSKGTNSGAGSSGLPANGGASGHGAGASAGSPGIDLPGGSGGLPGDGGASGHPAGAGQSGLAGSGGANAQAGVGAGGGSSQGGQGGQGGVSGQAGFGGLASAAGGAAVAQACPGNVSIVDAFLEAAVRSALGKPTGNITGAEAAALTQLTASTNVSPGGVTNLSGIECFSGLRSLVLENNQIVDVSPLAGLINLTYLSLRSGSAGKIADISPLTGLRNLQTLLVDGNQIRDITPLTSLSQLTNLQLGANPLVDISPVATMTGLTILSLTSDQVSSLAPLSNLHNLIALYLEYSGITDLTALTNLTNLTNLALGNNQINNVSPLSGLIKLNVLDLNDNPLANIAPLASLLNLETLNLNDTLVSNLSALANMTKLYNLGAGGSPLADVTPLASLTSLGYLDLGYSSVSNLGPLANLTNLTNLSLNTTPTADISPLAALLNLEDLNLGNTQVIDISVLKNLTNLSTLSLENDSVSDISPLVANPGIGAGDSIILYRFCYSADLQTLQARDVNVSYENNC